MSFDDAWKDNRHVWESTKNLAKAMYLAGAASRQAEIDELKWLLKNANGQADDFCKESIELQKLIDKVLDKLSKDYYTETINERIDILKGKKDE